MIELLLKQENANKGNPYHAKDGKFTTGPGAGGVSSAPASKSMTYDEKRAKLAELGYNPDNMKKSVIDQRIQDYEEYQKNFESAKEALKKAGLSDAQINQLDDFKDAQSWIHEKRVTIESADAKSNDRVLINGKREVYMLGPNGNPYRETYYGGKDADKAQSSLKPDKRIPNIAILDVYSNKQVEVDQHYKNGKWEDSSYTVTYTSNDKHKTFKEMKVGETVTDWYLQAAKYSSNLQGAPKGAVYFNGGKVLTKFEEGSNGSVVADASLSLISNKGKREIGVSWSSWGTQDLNTSKAFSKNISKAVEYASELTTAMNDLAVAFDVDIEED